MALSWCWAFGQESGADLVAMGWAMQSTSTTVMEPRTTYQYTYAGSPTRYSWAMDQTTWFQPPDSAVGPEGWVAIAVYHDDIPQNGQYMIRIMGASSSRITGAQMLSSGALKIYVDSTFKATTAVIPWQGQWHYVAMSYKMTTATWIGQLWVDGVAQHTAAVDAGSIETDATVRVYGASNGDRTQYVGQLAIWDSFTDPGSVARYVTRADVGADVSETGTWAPSTGATNHGVVGGTFDAATYTEEAAPTAADEVRVAPAVDIATALGISPSTIDGVCAHTYALGLGHTARADIGDGAATTTGTAGAISSATTERHVVAPTKPSGGSWTGTDTPQAVYHVVSV